MTPARTDELLRLADEIEAAIGMTIRTRRDGVVKAETMMAAHREAIVAALRAHRSGWVSRWRGKSVHCLGHVESGPTAFLTPQIKKNGVAKVQRPTGEAMTEGDKRFEVRSEEVARVAEAIRLRSCERGYPVHPNVAHHLAAAALEAMHASAQAVPNCGYIDFEYTNWEGRKALRCARPISIRFGKSEWHPKPQWLLLAFDIEKGAEREFAMADMAFEDDAIAALALTMPSASRGTEA